MSRIGKSIQNDLWRRGRRAREINDQELPFGYRNVLKLDHGDGHKLCKYTKTHCIVHSKQVNLWNVVFLNKAI